MKLSRETIDYLAKLMRVAQILKIESVVLDQEAVRGQLQTEGSILLHRENLPNFEFQRLGITRVNTLINRMNLLGENMTVEAQEKAKNDTETVIFKLILSNNKTEIEFKCADPALMEKAPKNLRTPIYYSFDVDKDTITTLGKSQSAIQGEVLTFMGQQDGVVCKISDTDGDMFSHVVAEAVEISPDCNKPKFATSFKHKILLPLLKEAYGDKPVRVGITDRGLLTMKIHGINIFISPEL